MGISIGEDSEDNTIRIWNLSGNSVLVIKGHPNNVLVRTAWNPVYDILASIGAGHQIQLWNPETGEELGSIASGQEFLMALVWSPDGTRLAVASYEGPITIWEITR